MSRDSNCYSYVVYTSNNPIFKKVPLTIILTMESSERNIDHLNNLCSKTIVQINKGFRTCTKSNVNNSSTDLLHAYKAACRVAIDENVARVLILEDDAQLFDESSYMGLRDVDTFVAEANFDAYTLGSIGDMTPYIGNHYKINLSGCTQAIIWSRNLLQRLLDFQPSGYINHIDQVFLNSCQTCNFFTYKTPLIVQMFPVTENRNSWCFICTKNNTLDSVFRSLINQTFKSWGLDKNTDSWSKIYEANHGGMSFVLFYWPFFTWLLTCLIFVGILVAVVTYHYQK